MIHMFTSYLLHPWVYYELTSDQLPVGLIAQLVRVLHRYRRGHGFKSRPSLNYFSGFIFSTVEFITAMIHHLFKMLFRSSNI